MKKILLLCLLSITLISCNSLVKEFIAAPEIKAIRLASFSIADKQVIFNIDLYNPNAFSLPISGLSGDFKLNNLTIGTVNASSEQTLAAYTTQTIKLPIHFDANALLDATKSVLTQRQALYRFNGNIATSIGSVPISQAGELSVQEIISGLLY